LAYDVKLVTATIQKKYYSTNGNFERQSVEIAVKAAFGTLNIPPEGGD
jgi:hypothetical protein